MRKHRIIAIIASLLAVTVVLASCASTDAKKTAEVSCDGNVAEQIPKTEAELKDARQNAKDALRTPAEQPASERVTKLEATLDSLRSCAKGTTPASTPVTAKCESTWARADSDKAGHRWFANGIPSIAEAITPEQAQAAAHDWFSASKVDPVTLSGAAKYLIDRDVNQAELFDSNGCATQVAVDLVAEAEAALALSMFKAEEAPSNGYNSGATSASVVGSAKAGVSGDRRAVKVTTPKGVVIWVMARCGNPVTVKPHRLVPKGPTDEAPTTSTTTSTTQPRLTPKDPSKDINNNPNVPPEVRKDRPSPDNQPRIDAGPTKPVDTLSGCDGPCPVVTTTVPRPPSNNGSPTTTVPVSHGGNTGVTAPPKSAPPVAPPTTASPQVPVTSP